MRITLLAAALVVALATPVRAITSGQAPAASDRRFDAVAGFTRTEWANINNCFGNATLISRDRVVLARHLINEQFRTPTSTDAPPAEFTVRFRRRPDGGLGDVADPTTFFHVRVKEWVFPTGRSDKDDIVIGVLETPVSHIAPMTVDFKPRLKANSTLMLASWGPESPPTGVVPKGRLLLGNVRLRSSGAWLALAAPGRDTPTEVVLNDSGAPMLWVSGNSVRMIGFATSSTGGPSLRPWDGSRLFPKPPKRR